MRHTDRHTPIDMHEDDPDIRTPAERERQRREFLSVMADAQAKLDAAGTEDMVWARLATEGRTFASENVLYGFLTAEHRKIVMRALGLSDLARVNRMSRALWREIVAASTGAAPTHQPEGIRFAACAFSPCRRQYDATKGFGVFCSKACMIDEANTPGTFAPSVPLVDEDEEAHAMNRAREVESICAGFGLTPDGMPLPGYEDGVA